jgi:hypothetical protein
MASDKMLERARVLHKRWNGYSDLDTCIADELATVQRETAEECRSMAHIIALNAPDVLTARGAYAVEYEICKKFLEGK